jgi:hypothetical protein
VSSFITFEGAAAKDPLADPLGAAKDPFNDPLIEPYFDRFVSMAFY